MFGRRKDSYGMMGKSQVLERLLSLAAGVALIDRGLRKGGLDGAVSIIAGSFLTSRGFRGDFSAIRKLSDTTQFHRKLR